jgi:hypothetical protein
MLTAAVKRFETVSLVNRGGIHSIADVL